MEAKLYTGCMGFAYKEWVGPFYRPGTASRNYLAAYARCFNTVELDTTFYAPPRESAASNWREETPDGFTFAAKVWQRITHQKRFVHAEADLAVFLRAVEPLGAKLGPLLIQCPPDLTLEALPAFAAFVRALPNGFQWAVEFRHRSWLVPEVRELLVERNVCLVGADLYYMPKSLIRTADFAYVRLLGNRKQITGIGEVVRDRTADVAGWAQNIEHGVPDGDVGWVFANNHYSGFSPHTIGMLMRDLGLEAPVFPVDEPLEQPSLFG